MNELLSNVDAGLPLVLVLLALLGLRMRLSPRAWLFIAAPPQRVFDLLDLWEPRGSLETLRIAPWDNHPNAQGNRVIAEQLHLLLQQSGDSLQMQPRGSNAR